MILTCLLAVVAGCGDSLKSSKTLPRVVRVAAASDLQFAFEDIAKAFQTTNPGIEVAVTYGSSGNFFAQLASGAPFDLFLSADRDYPRKLVELGLADGGSEHVYAIGHLALWLPIRSPLDLNRLGIEALKDPSLKKLAIANPKHAPYGRAAEAALKNLGIYDQMKSRLVLGDNIAQTGQFVESGAADIGILSLSLAMAPPLRDKGRFWKIPAGNFPPLEQVGVVMEGANDKEAAQALLAFMNSQHGRAILKEFGFDLPGD